MSLSAPARGRRLRPLRQAHVGRPAPFRITGPAYTAALAGWAGAALLLLLAAPALADGNVSGERAVAAAHLVGVVFFPFAVAAAVWQLLPVMLRTDPALPQARWAALVLIAAGAPLAWGVAGDRSAVVGVSAALLAAGLVLLLAELASLVRRAPRGKVLVVSRPAVALAGLHAALAFTLGAVVFSSDGPEPLGVPYERLLLVHLLLALIGWLTVMIAAVGRTLVPMLGLAAAAPRRSVPAAELTVVGGLWLLVAGIAASLEPLAAAGVVVVLAGLAAPAWLFARVALQGKPGRREGPIAHVVVGLVFVAEAAVVALLALAGVGDLRRATIAGVVLVGLGWAAGVVVGHLGKLISLSGWGSWPPGPRPRQAELYPRRAWLVEAGVFAVGVQLLALGILAGAENIARSGAALLLCSTVLAGWSAGETIRRIVTGRPGQPSSSRPSESA
ncbi:MAG TPA: hypothetical protein VFO81_08275 [Gaiellaceae bacterium]|nr:hypothetical protein [Gaiellaceae bacterium]